jgi:hypothetical protein
VLFDIEKVSFLGWKFDVTQDGEHVASINLKAFKEGAVIEIHGEPFKVGREGLASGAFFIEAFDTRLAEADKSSALRRRFDVRFAERRFSLEAVSAFRREFVAIEKLPAQQPQKSRKAEESQELQSTPSNPNAGEIRELGRIAPKNWYGQSATAKFDAELPIALDVFLIALTLLMWKRAAEAAS